jgi:hypothetical protein
VIRRLTRYPSICCVLDFLWTHLLDGNQFEAIHENELVGGDLSQCVLGGSFFGAMPEIAKP